ncbi:N-succinylarginine dihydrolase 1 [Sphingomonas antarctica]|uniref:N-succinylarginine dihydrolase n=1 Tax=Sphingomonas antarctica TaxID=2040274 RepID=UPI0039ECA3B7
MPLVEVNFDGIVGPSHNYAGLSFGNLAATGNAGKTAHPRAAALQGVAKMRHNLALGLPQGILLPHPRPDARWLASLATDAAHAEPHLLAQSLSASAMWAANAATVSPAPDTLDGKCHLSAANLVTMLHRSHEWPETLRQLRLAFGGSDFVVHAPVPAPFSDEGAANHMRLCERHDAPGVGVFVYGERGGPFPARQHIEASKAVARAHGVRDTVFAQQSEEAIAAGAFHNDVVAVANETVLFAHEQAFADKQRLFDTLAAKVSGFQLVEVPAAEISLADAIKSYLFNAQLVTLPTGGMALILPTDAQDVPAVWNWLQTMIAGNGPIRQLLPVDVRESMANGGGPACLRLRVVCDPGTIDPRFMVDAAKLDAIAAVISAEWPEAIEAAQLNDLALHAQLTKARESLFETLNLTV